MAKYRVLKPFIDIETKDVYEKGQIIEMTVKRANEAMKNLEKWGGEFLERVGGKEKDSEGDEK